MDLRLALYELAAEHRLDREGLQRLWRLAALDEQPPGAARWLPRGVAVLAAALGGLGIVLWIAANWDTLGRFGRFALLQVFVLVMCLGALWRPTARAPLGLLALLGTGALFAYFGQTYQTGADPWQLFALWAVLTLPLCLAVRSDVLWAPWALIVMTAVSLWVHAHTGHRWRVQPDDLQAHLMGWLAAAALAGALSPLLQRYTGAGPWALRTAATLAVVMVTSTALGGLFHRDIAPHYWLGLVLFALVAAVLALPRCFEVYVLSAVALGWNTLVVVGLVRWLFDRPQHSEPIGSLFLIGLVAAGLLATTVSGVMRLSRRAGLVGGAA